MKKETIIAILVGCALGLLTAVFVILQTKEKQLDTAKPITNQTKSKQSNPSKIINQTILEIKAPTQGIIVSQDSVTIDGEANKDALIIIQSPIKEVIFKNTKTKFTQKFPLAFGENIIQIIVYPKDKNLLPLRKELKVYYLDEK